MVERVTRPVYLCVGSPFRCILDHTCIRREGSGARFKEEAPYNYVGTIRNYILHEIHCPGPVGNRIPTILKTILPAAKAIIRSAPIQTTCLVITNLGGIQ